jgi:dolichol-phosphate mannosyltransferase
LSPKYRFWLKRPQPWIAVVLALIVFSPVIIWNYQHEWASFAFQSTRTVGQKGTIPRRVGIFWMMQLGVLTPLGLALLAVAGWQAVQRGWFKHADNWNFAGSFGLPLFFLFVAASFKTDVHINWTAPAFLALLPAASALWLEGLASGAEKCRRWWRIGTWSMAVLGGLILVAVHFSLATGQPERFAYSHANGWRELADSVRPLRRDQQARDGRAPFIIGVDKYNLAAELGFYLGQPADCVNGYAYGSPGLGYRYWTDLQQFKGRTALIIVWATNPAPLARLMQTLREHFDRVDEPRPLFVDAPGKNWKTVQIVVGYGYRPGPITSMRDASLD